jgi:hypothetical protein
MLDKLQKAQVVVRERHDATEAPESRKRIGIYLDILYRLSTCADGCRGGDHRLEYLCGRAFNLAAGAYELIRIGLYDEALNLLRSLGELVNLLALSVSNGAAFADWAKSDYRERMARFGPAKVRKQIEDAGGALVMDADTYSHLCEIGTHVTPQTAPNLHSGGQNPNVGGVFQEKGQQQATELLEYLLYFASTAFTAMLKDPAGVDQIPSPPTV